MRSSCRCFCQSLPKKVDLPYNRTHKNCSEKRFVGFVGGYAHKTPGPGYLSPALAYIDEVYLNNGISDRILKVGYPKNNGSTDIFSATFQQNNYIMAYSALYNRNLQAILDANKSPNGRVKWPSIQFEKIKNCIGRGVQLLQRQGISEIHVDPFTNAESAAEATYLAAYRFDELKNPRKHLPRSQFSCFTTHLDNDPDCFEAKGKLLSNWNRGRILAVSQNLARRWMEMPANLFPPKVFAHSIEEVFGKVNLQGDTKLEVIVHDRDWCIRQNMGGILGVSAGSTQEPVFVEINYVGDKSRPDEHIALVGKGVTFDAGGISIKPSAGMEDMRADMGGAAVIAATVLGLAKLNSPINVRAYLPLVENMPDGGAIRPGDVLRMANNMTVQVDNTDAEGRLILADALYFATHNPTVSVRPSLILDAATLTGAISVALGDQFTGFFCNNTLLRTRISDIWPPRKCVTVEEEEEDSEEDDHEDVEAIVVERLPEVSPQYSPSVLSFMKYCGRLKCDQFWHMPSLYAKQLQDNCHLADLSNITTGAQAKLGGSGSAASFLQYFVSFHIPYVHLDIAGVMKTSIDEPYLRRGMTGRPTRPLIHFFDHIARRVQGTKSAITTNNPNEEEKPSL